MDEKYPTRGSALLQPFPIARELFQSDVPFVAPLQTDTPGGHRNLWFATTVMGRFERIAR
jgi:hypothetical protein